MSCFGGKSYWFVSLTNIIFIWKLFLCSNHNLSKRRGDRIKKQGRLIDKLHFVFFPFEFFFWFSNNSCVLHASSLKVSLLMTSAVPICDMTLGLHGPVEILPINVDLQCTFLLSLLWSPLFLWEIAGSLTAKFPIMFSGYLLTLYVCCFVLSAVSLAEVY